MKQIISITQTAGKQLINIAKHNNVKNILFSITGGGCNGFNYKFTPLNSEQYESKKNKFDEHIKYENIKIIVCGHSLLHLLGTTIDWKKDIMGEAFHFENPNAVSQCGCGTSFSL